MHGMDVVTWEGEVVRRRDQLLEEARARRLEAQVPSSGRSLGRALRRSLQQLVLGDAPQAPCPEVRLARG